jgi:hypothetical protein
MKRSGDHSKMLTKKVKANKEESRRKKVTDLTDELRYKEKSSGRKS